MNPLRRRRLELPLKTLTTAPVIAIAPASPKLPYAVAVAPAAPPALIVPTCFVGDEPLPADHPNAKTEAVGHAIAAAAEQTPGLRFLDMAWRDALRHHQGEVTQLADDIDANLRASAAQPRRPFKFEMVDLTEDTPLVLRATKKRVHVGWDPRHVSHAQAAELFHLCADSAGVDLEGVEFPTLQQLADDAEKTPPGYVPPTEWDDAEGITLAGKPGAFLKACMFTPTWQGIPEGPTVLSVYSEPDSAGELDLAGANQFIADLEAFLPKLRAMRDVLAEAAGE